MSTAMASGGVSISETAYEQLARDIGSCALAPGSPINERAEAARLGMSRTPFRQALHRLAAEGLIVAVPKRGTYVAPLDPRDIIDNMAVRQALEVQMARRVIDASMPLDFRELDRLISVQREAASSGDWLRFLAADEAFHASIMAAADNPRASEAVRRAWIHVNRARYLVPMSQRQIRDAIRGHRVILAALAAGDSNAVASAIEAHLGPPLVRLLSDLSGRQPHAFAPGAKYAEVSGGRGSDESLDGGVAGDGAVS
ncbi:MAG: GntR family transcriptional regulator [Candidatus Dormibacteria bacterium]